jgi:hypothetical protein
MTIVDWSLICRVGVSILSRDSKNWAALLKDIFFSPMQDSTLVSVFHICTWQFIHKFSFVSPQQPDREPRVMWATLPWPSWRTTQVCYYNFCLSSSRWLCQVTHPVCFPADLRLQLDWCVATPWPEPMALRGRLLFFLLMVVIDRRATHVRPFPWVCSYLLLV